MTRVKPCYSEVHSLCKEASRIGVCCSILVPACLITFTGGQKSWPGTLKPSGLDSGAHMAGHACQSHRHASFFLNPTTNQYLNPSVSALPASDLPPLLPSSVSEPDSTPGLHFSLFPTSKVGHCLLCIIQQLE